MADGVDDMTAADERRLDELLAEMKDPAVRCAPAPAGRVGLRARRRECAGTAAGHRSEACDFWAVLGRY